MSENKKSFVAYSDWEEMFQEISDADAGQLIKHIFAHVNGRNPETNNPLVKALFIPIKLQLKRDSEKWDKIREKRSEAGRNGGLAKANQNKQMLANAKIAKQNVANLAVNDNVNVTVNVNDIIPSNEGVLKKETEKEKIAPPIFNVPPSENSFDRKIHFNQVREEMKRIFGHCNGTVYADRSFKALEKKGVTTKDIFKMIHESYLDPYHKMSEYAEISTDYFAKLETYKRYAEPKKDPEKPKIDVNRVLKVINEEFGRNGKIISEKVKQNYNARGKEGYTTEDIITSIRNAKNSEFHTENGYIHLTLEFFSRPDKIDKYQIEQHQYTTKNGSNKTTQQQQQPNRVDRELERLQRVAKLCGKDYRPPINEGVNDYEDGTFVDVSEE